MGRKAKRDDEQVEGWILERVPSLNKDESINTRILIEGSKSRVDHIPQRLAVCGLQTGKKSQSSSYVQKKGL